MSTTIFLSSINPILKNDGTVNSAGTINFYEIGTAFATPKAVYADSALATSLGSTATLSSAGTLAVYLDGDYDIKIFDSNNSLIRSVYNIASSGAEIFSTNPNLAINGSFEDATGDGLPVGWTLFEWNTGSTIVDTVAQTHGTKSIKFVSVGSGGGYVTSTLFTVSPLRPVQIAFGIESGVNPSARNLVQVLWYDKDQSLLSFSTGYDSTTTPTTWTNVSFSVTPPAGAVLAALKLVGADSSNATATYTRFDDVRVDSSIILETANTWKGANIYDAAATFNNSATFNDPTTHTDKVTMSAAAINLAAEVTITAATTPAVGAAASNNIIISGGSGPINGFDTVAAGIVRTVRFLGAYTLTHNATSFILPGGINIVTVSGDVGEFESLGSGNWVCRFFSKGTTVSSSNRIWNDVTGSRALCSIGLNDVVYQNTHGYEIGVAIHATTQASSHLALKVGPSSPPTLEISSFASVSNTNGADTTINGLVPNGWYYEAYNDVNGAAPLVSWYELY